MKLNVIYRKFPFTIYFGHPYWTFLEHVLPVCNPEFSNIDLNHKVESSSYHAQHLTDTISHSQNVLHMPSDHVCALCVARMWYILIYMCVCVCVCCKERECSPVISTLVCENVVIGFSKLQTNYMQMRQVNNT